MVDWGGVSGRARDAEELDCFDIEVLLNLMDLLRCCWTLVVGRIMSLELLILGFWQALAVEADFALLVDESDGVLALQGVDNLLMI